MKRSVLKQVRLALLIASLVLLPIGVVACSPILGIGPLGALLAPAEPEDRLDYVTVAPVDGFSFSVVSDMRKYSGPGTYDTSDYFRGALEALAGVGMGSFLVVPGDMDPVPDVQWTIEQVLGTGVRWYPVMGNHELPGEGDESSYGANLAALQAFDYGVVNPGPTGCPKTTYSFDYGNAHFVALNEYCTQDGPDDTWYQVSDHVYNWLVADLNATEQPYIIIFGHAPGYPQADDESDRMRHEGESLDYHPDLRDRFWALMAQHDVVAYICGHTHNYSTVKIGGVWQIDSGHARGVADTGARSTFVVVNVGSLGVTYHTYRLNLDTDVYVWVESGVLVSEPFDPVAAVYLPLVVRRD